MKKSGVGEKRILLDLQVIQTAISSISQDAGGGVETLPRNTLRQAPAIALAIRGDLAALLQLTLQPRN